MPVLEEQKPKAPGAARSGCLVTGTIVGTGGKVAIYCEQGGVWDGVVYGTQPLPLTPDGVPLKNGEISIMLPPSSAVGGYILRVGSKIWHFRVPDEAQADLSALLGVNHGN